MNWSIWLLVSILVVKIKHVCVLTRCPVSLSTVESVMRCPRNKAEWENQAKKKNCAKLSQSCVKPEEFLYHCLMNEYMNMTIEVCAPSVFILGQKCAEFNTVGTVVQDNIYAKCDDSDPPCPFRYNSTELYKYQRCYSYIKSSNSINVLPSFPDKTRDKDMCSCNEKAWLAVSVVFIILSLISSGFGGILFYKYRNLPSRTLSQKPEDMCEKKNSATSELQHLLDKNKDKTIKLREVAISPYIHEVKASVTCLNFNVDNLIFKENTTYVNLHVGSKYCNLTFLSATDPKSPDRIIGEPYRQKWGNSKPEVQFLNRLKELFTEAIFKEWKEKYYWEYISLLWHFEDQKTKMCENLDDNEKYVFELSSKLFKPFKEDQSKMVSLKDRLKKPGEELEMNESDCSIVFKWSYLKTFFTGIKDGTRNMIQGHKIDLKEVRCVIMTGSFSQMKLFLHAAEIEWFKDLTQAVTVVIPVHIGSTYAYFFNKYPKWIFYDLISK